MKIIKQFEDQEYYNKHCYGYTGQWLWGLGDDGNIYHKADYHDHWIDNNGLLPIKLSLRDMKKLIKKFDYLLAFL